MVSQQSPRHPLSGQRLDKLSLDKLSLANDGFAQRSALIACLEWQYACGHDTWIKSWIKSWIKPDEAVGDSGGWQKADEVAHRLLQSLTLRPALRPVLHPILPPVARSQREPPHEAGIGVKNVSTKMVKAEQAGALAPTAALVQAERLALSCDDLAELERAVLTCDLCPLHKAARNGVFAEGNPQSGLMIVGEAPGKEEDEQGKPFVGASGQLLMRMLAHIGITSREQYYITNLVYWRPPGNRPPTSDELLVCHPFFKRQLALVRPRVLLLLGNVAAQTILREKSGITRLRGKFFEYSIEPAYKKKPSPQDEVQSGIRDKINPAADASPQVVQVLATFHPSYLLRTPVKKSAAWHDLLLLRQALQGSIMRK